MFSSIEVGYFGNGDSCVTIALIFNIFFHTYTNVGFLNFYLGLDYVYEEFQISGTESYNILVGSECMEVALEVPTTFVALS